MRKVTFGVVSTADEAWVGQEGGVGRAWKAFRGLTIVSGKAVQGSISDTFNERVFMDFMQAKCQKADAKYGGRRLQ